MQGRVLLELDGHYLHHQSSTVSMCGNDCFLLNFTFPVFKLNQDVTIRTASFMNISTLILNTSAVLISFFVLVSSHLTRASLASHLLLQRVMRHFFCHHRMFSAAKQYPGLGPSSTFSDFVPPSAPRHKSWPPLVFLQFIIKTVTPYPYLVWALPHSVFHYVKNCDIMLHIKTERGCLRKKMCKRTAYALWMTRQRQTKDLYFSH